MSKKSVSEIFEKPLFFSSMQPDNSWPLPKQAIGLEFEFEGALPGSWPGQGSPLWNFFLYKEDGSLRDHGLELVFHNPLFGKDIIDALTTIREASTRWTVNHRTGLHVHLDVRDMEQEELFRLFQLYALFERMLFKFVGDSRAASNFCVPWFRCTEQFRTMGVLTRDLGKVNSVKESFNNLTRYVALNVAALAKFGSIEFRHMQNTHDYGRINTWIKFIMCLKKAAHELKFEKDELLLEISKAGPMNFIDKVFGNLAGSLLLPYEVPASGAAFEMDFNKGLETAQDLVISSTVINPFYSLSFLKSPDIRGEPPGIEKFLKKRLAQNPNKESL